MLGITKTLSVTAIVCAAHLCITDAVGAESASTTVSTNLPFLKSEIRREGGPEDVLTTRAYVTAGTNQYGFELPEGFKIVSQVPGALSLINRDLTGIIEFRIVPEISGAGKAIKSEIARQVLSDKIANAVIGEEFSLPVIGRPGTGFEYQSAAANGLRRKGWVVYVSSDNGTLEFSVNSDPSRFEGMSQNFKYFLLTFRASDASGKLKMPRRPLHI